MTELILDISYQGVNLTIGGVFDRDGNFMSIRLLLIGLALTCSQQAFATTLISGYVSAGTNATFGTLTDPKSATSNLAALGSIMAQSLSAIDDGAGSIVNSNVSVKGLWSSADSGTFSINWGWDVNANGQPTKAETNQVPANWRYTFIATGNGIFNVNGRVAATGNTFGLQPIYFGGDGIGSIGGTVFDPTGSGALAFSLLSGQTYTFLAYNFGNVYNSTGFTASGSATSDFSWNIKYNVSAVPVPAALPLLASGIIGLGAVGARRRSKRKLAQ